MVAWCTQPGHGTRVIPDGTITGVQFTKAPNYVQVVGFMDQTKINMIGGDAGGEMDPHGADRVSPLVLHYIRTPPLILLLSAVILWEASCSPTLGLVRTSKPLSGTSEFGSRIFRLRGC